MRFELTQAGGRAEFRVFDVDQRLEAALAGLAWERFGTATGQNGWRRSFAVAAEQARHAFDNTQRLLLPMLRQAADIDPVIWDSALEEVCSRFGAAGLDWWLCGSAALSVRGAPLIPHDLDLIVAETDSVRAGELLADGLIEPVTTAEWPLSTTWGRAFLHARIEWLGGVTVEADLPDVTDFGRTAASRLETVRWRGWEIRVPPLDLQRAVCERRGLADRVAMIDALAVAT